MELNSGQVDALVDSGFKLWERPPKRRLYIDANALGLECFRYDSGNISVATMRGKKISNNRARELDSAKTYIDIATGKVISTDRELKKLAAELMNEVLFPYMEELEE